MRAIAIFTTLAALATPAATGGAEPKPFHGNIDKLTRQNDDFRRVLFTGVNVQVVAMSLREKEDIGEEIHDVDQCFFFVNGEAETIVKGNARRMDVGGAVCVPAGVRHNVRNARREPLKLFTIYSPPQHPDRTVHRTKADAERAEGKPAPKPKK
jgi:mannose-6-phosphate isomerase-like protein (cupin superfamily)